MFNEKLKLTVTSNGKEGIKMLKVLFRRGLNLTIAVAFAISIFAPTPPADADTLRANSIGVAPVGIKLKIASELVKAASAGFRDRNKKIVEDILDPAKPYFGYDIILVVTTEEEECEAVQRDFDIVFGARRENKENGVATVIAVNIDIANRGQLIDTGYALLKAVDKMGKEGVDLVKELKSGKTICAILDAGAGKRGGNLTLSENGSRGTVHIGGKLKNGISMTTLIKGAATSALFAKSGKGYIDVFYTASQAVIPDADVTAETEPGNVRGLVIKFAQDVSDASQINRKTTENFGVYEIDGKTGKVRSHPKWTWSRDDEAKPFAKTNVSIEKGLANYHAAMERGDRWGFSMGSHRVNIDFELALLEFLKEIGRLGDPKCPKLEPPMLILPVLTYRELAEQNRGQEKVNRAEVLKNIKGDISPESANLALDFYEWYIEKHGGKSPEHFLGLSGIGSDLYWWIYRESFGILNNSLLMLSDLLGKKIQVDNQGVEQEEDLKPEHIKEARVLRELHNITCPIMDCTLGGIYVDENGRYTENGQERQVTFEDMKKGVTIGGVEVRGILLNSNLCKGSVIYGSFVEDTTATELLKARYAYVARCNVSYAEAEGALLYNVKGKLDKCVKGQSCTDVFRAGLRGRLRDEKFPEGQTRLFQKFDANPNKQFETPYPEPLPDNRFSYQQIYELDVAGATEIRNRIADLFMPKSSSAATLKGVVFDLDGVITSTERIHFINWKRMFDEEFRNHPETAGREFTYDNYLEHVDGIPRYDGCLSMFLAANVKEFECLREIGHFIDKTKKEQLPDYEKLLPGQQRAMERIRELGDKKNKWYNEHILAHPEEIEILSGAFELLRALKTAGIRRIAVASSSKNTPTVLRLAGLSNMFDVVISGHDIGEWSELQQKVIEGKPKPDIFIEAALRMSIKPSECVGFEDALKGVQAIQAAGMPCVGVDKKNKGLLGEYSDLVIKGLTEIDVKKMRDLVASKSSSGGAIKGVILDVEGVIISTSKIRYLSWKEIIEGEFNSHPETMGREFTTEDYDKIMNGLAAGDACLAVLVAYGIEKFKCLKGMEHFIDETANPDEFEKLTPPQKEAMEEIERLIESYESKFFEYINDYPYYIEVLPGIERFLRMLKTRGIRLGVVSSGKGIKSILTLVGLEDMFEVFISGEDIGEWSVIQHRLLRPKPYPDMFIEATLRMNLEPMQCAGFEDTKSGVQAIKAAEMVSVGVDIEKTGRLTVVADVVTNDFASVNIDDIEKLVAAKSSSGGAASSRDSITPHQLATWLMNYAPVGEIAVAPQNQAVVIYSDALIQSEALQEIISTHEKGGPRRLYLVNKEGISNEALFASLKVKGITRNNLDHIFIEDDPATVVNKIAPVLMHNGIFQVRVFALNQEDVSAWSRQQMVDALIMLLDTKELIIVSPDELRRKLYEQDMNRNEVLSQV